MSDIDLFTPLQLGPNILANRMVMAPLTRNRSTPEGVPHALNVEYYRQRAGAGLILSEATCIMPEAVGYPLTPGIWNDAQAAGWKAVTDAVHSAGGKIFCQLWHVGRISHPDLQPGGILPVARRLSARLVLVKRADVERIRDDPPRPGPVPRERSAAP